MELVGTMQRQIEECATVSIVKGKRERPYTQGNVS